MAGGGAVVGAVGVRLPHAASSATQMAESDHRIELVMRRPARCKHRSEHDLVAGERCPHRVCRKTVSVPSM
jgi:hypothetical protein